MRDAVSWPVPPSAARESTSTTGASGSVPPNRASSVEITSTPLAGSVGSAASAAVAEAGPRPQKSGAAATAPAAAATRAQVALLRAWAGSVPPRLLDDSE